LISMNLDLAARIGDSLDELNLGELLLVLVLADELVLEAHRKYQPVVEFAPGSAAARDYRRLAHATTEWPAPQGTATRRFFMNRRARSTPATAGTSGG